MIGIRAWIRSKVGPAAIGAAILIGNLLTLNGQESDAVQIAPTEMSIRDFRPRPMLIVPQSSLSAAHFPVIDIHTHFRYKLAGASTEQIQEYVRDVLDQHNVAVCVSLDATLGNEDEHLKLLGGDLADRFGVFVHIDFVGAGKPDQPETWWSNQPEFVRATVEQLKVARAKGCLGLKFFKQFGLEVIEPNGERTRIDDPRFDPIWATCGELKMPVLIHVADPAAFFEPVDKFNERWEELSRHPDWSFADPKFPRRPELLDSLLRVVKKHRKTTFVAAHCANYAEDLQTLGKWLDENPNLYIDISSRIGELGRQPYTARAFFDRMSDRILFGTDGPWPAQRLTYYWRFLETFDEYFPYSEKEPPPQGLWAIYGLGLRQETLTKVYFENALKLMPQLQDKYNRASALLAK